jgi:hypothetical protein
MAPQGDSYGLVNEAYARWLDAGTKLGFILLIAGFVAYAFGITAPYVPFDRLPALWSLPVDQYNAATHAPTGWQWVHQWWHSDYLTYFGVVALLLTTIASMLRTMLVLYALDERLHASIALLQVVVLVLAAAGVVSGH